MKLVFFTFYYPPDLCAGSFRAVALAEALSNKLNVDDEIHIITTHPNRYASHKAEAESDVLEGNVRVHRIRVPVHKSGMASQARSFLTYSWHAFFLCLKIRPDFIIGTTSRLMTGVLTWFSAAIVRCRYFIDLRDIFSETISDVFSLKSRFIGRVVKIVFSFIEKRVFTNAAGVNVVSLGFPDYFEAHGISTCNWTFFPNGVDREFIGLPRQKNISQDEVITILYAGNIGSGQGLETIVPTVAQRLGNQYKFIIIGDGGTKHLLKKKIEADGIKNIELLPPVSREKLTQYYNNSDMLFLHLNDLPAFKRVLPSKIFEYTALGKPVIAGLSGYSAQFVRDHVGFGCVFSPGDASACVSCVERASLGDITEEVVENFISKYSRESIMNDMSNHILSVITSGAVNGR
ncbi:MAG: glycosyltransferase family 4 protein [Candidatus Pacearchaeota archaeon]|nr:glycosyltransferase family 4 protein [Candidatus Pacearchaeota archaeon]